MSRFMEIKSKDIEKAFEDERRQYFVGNLKKPQHIPFVKSDNAEMGLTAYDKFTGEPAHRHSVAKEYAYVISGRTQYMDLDTREIYEYHAGDFFATFPGTTYVQKSEAGTKMIFVKEPSINDKELVPMDEEAKKWMETGARIVGSEMAKAIVDAWLDAKYIGSGRHERRVNMIEEEAAKYNK